MRLSVYIAIGVLAGSGIAVGNETNDNQKDFLKKEILNIVVPALGCHRAFAAVKSSLVFCVKNDVIDTGLPTELRGCSAKIYQIEDIFTKPNATTHPWLAGDQWAHSILSPKACEDGGDIAVLSLPVGEDHTVMEYIDSLFFGRGEVVDFTPDRTMNTYSNFVNRIISRSNGEIMRGEPDVPKPLPVSTLPTGQESGTLENLSDSQPQEKSKHTSVKVFYASDRKFVDSSIPAEKFTDARSDTGELTYGSVEVSIPVNHIRGNIDLPSVFSFQMTADPDQFMVLKTVQTQTYRDFFRGLKSRVRLSKKKDLFVFVHGFNVSFEAAALRTAQLAYDLQFEGAPVFYSWPSENLMRYSIAEINAEWTFSHLTGFLKDLAKKSGADQIHLIAHSMGNRALTKALDQLAEQGETELPKFQNVVLTAPDVGQSEFLQIEAEVRSTAKTLTLYTSDRDKALNISAAIHSEPRLGQAGQSVMILQGIDTIDASNVDSSFLGHSYFGENISVVKDIQNLILNSLRAKDREGLVRKLHDERGDYWQILKAN